MRALIEHRECPTEHTNNTQVDTAADGQRALIATVFSTIEGIFDHAVRARAWYREFRDIHLICQEF